MSTPRLHKNSTLRPLILSLIILALLSYGLPVGDSLAARYRRASVSRSKLRKMKQRRSRAWWRRRRAMLRRRRARALALRRLALPAGSPARADAAPRNDARSRVGESHPNAALSAVVGRLADAPRASASRLPLAANASARPARSPYALTLPASWSSAGASPSGEQRFNVRTFDGAPAGTASLSPMAAPRGDAPVTPRTKTLGGVPLASLRSTVIDRMVAEGGWVVNDMERLVADRRVYVVVAQTGAPDGPQRCWMFYFTEVEGRLYRLVTNTPLEQSETVAAASERLVASFRLGSGGPTLASKSTR